MQAKNMKTGPFTAKEGAVIEQRVAELGDNNWGLWASLSKELGRSANDIRKTWLRKLDPILEEYKRGAWSDKEVIE